MKLADLKDAVNLLFSPDGDTAAVQTAHGETALIDLPSGQLGFTIPHQAASFAFSADGKLLAISEKDHIYLWHTRQNQLVATLSDAALQDKTSQLIAFKADGLAFIAVYTTENPDTYATTSFVYVGAIETGRINQLATLEGGEARAFMLNLDNSALAIAGKDGVNLWNLAVP